MKQFISEDFNSADEERQNKNAGRLGELPGNANDEVNERNTEEAPKQNQDYLMVSPCDNKIKRGTIVLTILFSIGLLFVFVMIKKSSPSSAVGKPTNEELKIEAAITQLTGLKMGSGSQIDHVVRRFNQFSDVKKLQIEKLHKNPFVHEKYFESQKLTTNADDSELSMQAECMQLVSIMYSDEGNCCMINDKILYEGDRIGSFEVCKISEYSVELCASNGKKFTLKIPRDF
jgi:hypothetical protein